MFKTIDQTVLYQLEYIYFIISLSMSTPTLDWVWAVSDQTFLYRLDYIYFIICLSMSTPTLDWGWAVSERTIFGSIARK